MILAARTTAIATTIVVVDHFKLSFRIPRTVLKDCGLQSVPNVFQDMCAEPCVALLTATEYHPHTDGPVEWYNTEIVSHLCHCVAEHQRHWDSHVMTCAYAYDVQVNRSRNVVAYTLVLSRCPPGPASPITTKSPPDVNDIDTPLVM